MTSDVVDKIAMRERVARRNLHTSHERHRFHLKTRKTYLNRAVHSKKITQAYWLFLFLAEQHCSHFLSASI